MENDLNPKYVAEALIIGKEEMIFLSICIRKKKGIKEIILKLYRRSTKKV
jgi:hypothetical protein